MPRYASRQGMLPVGRPRSVRTPSLRDELNRLFEDYFYGHERRPFPDWRTGAAEEFEPSVDLHDANGELLVFVELPGLCDEDVDLEIDEDTVVVSGEKKLDHATAEGGRSWRESLCGRFQREIPLPVPIDIGKAEATFRHGVLRISLPKQDTGASRRRRITIRRSGEEGEST